MRIITSEQVSAGHPDKICDQIADAIVTDCLQHDRDSRVAIECLFKNRCLVIAGELTSTHEPDYKKLVQDVFDRINNGGAENRDAGLTTSWTSPPMIWTLRFWSITRAMTSLSV